MWVAENEKKLYVSFLSKIFNLNFDTKINRIYKIVKRFLVIFANKYPEKY